MKTKNLVLTLFTTLLFSSAFAQKRQNVYFLKNDGREVKLKDSADFIRIIQEPDSGSINYNVLEFYPDNSRKTIGTVSRFEPFLVSEGMKVSFYPNGKRKETRNFSNGKPIGESYSFYKNGKLMKDILYDTLANQTFIPGTQSLIFNFKLLSYFDSTGVQLVKDGNGYYKEYNEEEFFVEEGNYLDGLKEGVWTGNYFKSNNSYKEEYKRGQFISGVATLKNGDTVAYTKVDEYTTYKGGMDKFYQYVGKTYRYPYEAEQKGVSGSVLTSFVVDRDSSISDIKLIRDLGYGTGKEAIRVVQKSGNWIPGRQHGIPVRVLYNLPLSLQILGRR